MRLRGIAGAWAFISVALLLAPSALVVTVAAVQELFFF